MLVDDSIRALKIIAPLEYAAPWDNVGLLVGSPTWNADRALLTIDLTEPVLREAMELKAGLIVAYHPPIFEPMKSVTDATFKQRIILNAASEKIAIYSPHTALDAAPGGVNDWIAEGLGAGDVRALDHHEHLPETEQCKIITFCPAEAVDRIRDGLASIGAGRIGEYSRCSFEIGGRGTFLGNEASNPTRGRKGRFERVDEVRLEMTCPKAALALAAVTLKEFHPYEEPPMEILALLPRPQRNIGQGRRVVLDQSVSRGTLLERLKARLGVTQLMVAAGEGAPHEFTRIGLSAGAGGSLLQTAIDRDCQVFITGEMRHHDVLAAQARGCTVILAGHTSTERGYLSILQNRLAEMLAGAEVLVSKRDVDPLETM